MSILQLFDNFVIADNSHANSLISKTNPLLKQTF